MRLVLLLLCVAGHLFLCGPAAAQSTGNLLRNSGFQDDWITLTPENKNHHWCYPSEFANRRDFNPDGWTCKGSWQWLNADAPGGQRRLQFQGPGADITQRLNWIAVHHERQRSGSPPAPPLPPLPPQHTPP